MRRALVGALSIFVVTMTVATSSVLGLTPLAFTTTSSTTVGVISQWEPRLSVGLSF